MELALALVCDDARDDPQGKLDVHGIFNDLYAPGFPAKQDRMVLVLAIEWDHDDDGRYQFRVDLVGPDAKPSFTVSGHTDVDARPHDRPPPRTRLVMPLDDVVFPEPGPYRFQVKVKGQELGGPTLHLVRTEPETEPAGGVAGAGRAGVPPGGAAPGSGEVGPGDRPGGPEPEDG